MTKHEWKNLYKLQIKKQECYCYLCGKPIYKQKEFSLDHCVPRSRGGSDDSSNWMPTHKECNSKKGALTFEEWQLWLELERKRYGHIR